MSKLVKKSILVRPEATPFAHVAASYGNLDQLAR